MSMKKIISEKYTLPIAALLTVREEWRLAVNSAGDSVFSFTRRAQRAYRTVDAFEVRRAFLSLQTPDEAGLFFKEYGPFQYSYDKGTGRKKFTSKPEPITWTFVQRAKKDFEEALLADGVSPELYRFVFGRPLRIELEFRAITPDLLKLSSTSSDDAAIAPCEDVVDALRASIFLSRMSGFKWRRCARRGCNQLFEQDTKHRKIFHNPDCAHLQAVNDYNARKNKPEKRKSTKRASK